jgi:phosphoribosylformimino-5-aminoimidazole carboxamide ribotide isomerase
MVILPVLDVLQGAVVRGVAGRRAQYRPVVSRLIASSEPRAVAEAFRSQFGLAELYVADLDAIAGDAPSIPMYQALLRRGFRLWVDAGVRDRERADAIADSGLGIIIGLETVRGPTALADVLRSHADRAVFSLDLRDGVPLGDRAAWDGADAFAVAERAFGLGATRVLVLDLAHVGVGSGTGTEVLCDRLITASPQCQVWVGGGVRNADDLRRLKAQGVSAVLIASALHDGSVTRDDLLTLSRDPPAPAPAS